MTIFEEMVEALQPRNKSEKEKAQQEVMQRIALYGLYRGGFFDHAAFYGDVAREVVNNQYGCCQTGCQRFHLQPA